MSPAVAAAKLRLAAWRPHAAVIYGSGLWAPPADARIEDEVPYDDIEWPSAGVPGHENVLRLASVPAAGGRGLRLALACGRPHRYEGWSDDELERPVRAMVVAGVTRIVLTNSCGALRPDVVAGKVLACSGIVDLQRSPRGDEPPRLAVCDDGEAARVARALGSDAVPRPGTYVSVCGPQFETPAEAAWLAGYGDVVGMSAASEARAVAATGVECCLLALVANVAAAVASHEDVLAAGGRLARVLATGIAAAVVARWPGLLDAS